MIHLGWLRRVFCFGVCGIIVLCINGCRGEPTGYRSELRYPLRSERIVIALPPSDPEGLPPPGRFEEFLAGLEARGGRTLDPSELPPADSALLTHTLEELFGTPAAPRVPARADAVPGVDLSAAALERGAVLYAEQCGLCHGVSGSGRAFGSGFAHPLPRDYRSGVFKCAEGARKPTAGRLKRVLREGVPGTQMPVFDLLSENDVTALVGHVVHLSLRGEVEAGLLRRVLDPELGDSVAEAIADVEADVARVLGEWAQATEAELVAGVSEDLPDPAAMERGAAIYQGAGGCVACHGAAGAGGRYLYDVWGGVGVTATLTRSPSDYRWGKRAADVAGHIRGGIRGAQMPAASLSDAQVADVTAFVRGLSTGTLPGEILQRLNSP